MNDSLFSSAFSLPHLGAIVVTGPDARTYLQGQLSFDMDTLTPSRMELASCNSSQGRVQALLWMIERPEAVVLILPIEMVDMTVARLRKYVLRSKAKIESAANRWVIGGSFTHLDAAPRTHRQQADLSLVAWPGSTGRTLLVAPSDSSLRDDPSSQERWRLADIEAGLPQVYAPTHERFVAQMLNVDLLEGISFQKGCYTGQEIIARTHFRGTVKRRMLRFSASCPRPAPGTRVVGADGEHAGDVVDAAGTSAGCELLAVVSLDRLGSPLHVNEAALEQLTLPYELNRE